MNKGNTTSTLVLMLLPSLRISGGNKEALRLANDLTEAGVPVLLVVLWKSAHELPPGNVAVRYLSSFSARRAMASWQFPVLLARFRSFIRKYDSATEPAIAGIFLTHFSTFPFAWLAPDVPWYCFNQDVEWMFVKDGLLRSFLRWFILLTSRLSEVITTNAYVESLYKQEGVRPLGRLAIWTPRFWLTEDSPQRTIDVVMLLRRGHMKRLDLYIKMLELVKRNRLSYAVFTPDSDIYERIGKLGGQCILRPDDEAIRDIYKRSKVFLLLSDTEGFGLPPLEAMGSGCVPLCRDSGGPRSYMDGQLAGNLIPLDTSVTEIMHLLQTLLSDSERLLALSLESRRLFESGLLSTTWQREECITKLVSSLSNNL